jgi:hypothetical protein
MSGGPDGTGGPSVDEIRASALGRPFPGGSFVIEPWEAFLVADAVAADEISQHSVHPIQNYFAALGAAGVTLDEMFGWCLSAASEGPMLGSTRLELSRPLEVGVCYVVEGSFLSVERKRGARAGVFDIAIFQLTIRDLDAQLVSRTECSLIFPRKAAS